MANKYINTFDNALKYKGYLQSGVAEIPNIAYILDTDVVHYKSVIDADIEVIGSIVYSDLTYSLPEEPLVEGKTPIGILYMKSADSLDGYSKIIYYNKIPGNTSSSYYNYKGIQTYSKFDDAVLAKHDSEEQFNHVILNDLKNHIHMIL